MLSVFKTQQKIQRWKCSQITVIHQSDDEREEEETEMNKAAKNTEQCRDDAPWTEKSVMSLYERMAGHKMVDVGPPPVVVLGRSRTPSSCGTIFEEEEEEERYPSLTNTPEQVTNQIEESDWVVIGGDID
jgi:hypothetical protein